jgi:N-methylhydantoinase B
MSVALNPITYQVIKSRLSGIVREMQDSVYRTGYSTVVRESQDASCAIMDVNGSIVGEHIVIPVHLTSLPDVVRAVKLAFGDDIHPGDCFLTNHPYISGVAHSMDIAIVTPAFYDGELVAFCGSIAHKTDLGGVVPATSYAYARDIFQEGIQYPPVRMERDYQIDRDIEAIVRANSRDPENVLGDNRGQAGVARLGERRLEETFRRYGRENVFEAFAMMQDITERRLRQALAAQPDGVFEAEHFLDRDTEELIRYHVRITKRGDRITVDLSGCDDQVDAPVNIHPSVVRGGVNYAVLTMLDPGAGNNDGLDRVIEIIARPGSVVNPLFPAPTNSYAAPCTLISAMCIRAMCGLVPDRRIADCSLGFAIAIGGKRTDGSNFLQYELGGTASGGRIISDGPSAIGTLMGNPRCAPIEILESEFPTRILRWDIVPDSGGPGEFRGGHAPRRTWQALVDGTYVSLRGAGNGVPARGLDGGVDGRCARFTVNTGTSDERLMRGLFSNLFLRSGEWITDERGGGGGFGDPQRRPFERVLDDVLDGYVSAEAATRDYGIDRERLDAALAAWDSEFSVRA